jgi:hypothetical protein
MTEEQARMLFNEHREPGDMAHYGEKAAVAALMSVSGWQSIDSAPNGQCILYFPSSGGRNILGEMIKVDHHPVYYPRKPTHWMPLPSAPVPE